MYNHLCLRCATYDCLDIPLNNTMFFLKMKLNTKNKKNAISFFMEQFSNWGKKNNYLA